MYKHDERVVMTLDAGGTNFVFSAIKGCVPVVEPVCLLAIPDDLEKCLSVLLAGFSKVKEMLTEEPVAISFAFPGPADYENGVLGNLHNFPKTPFSLKFILKIREKNSKKIQSEISST